MLPCPAFLHPKTRAWADKRWPAEACSISPLGAHYCTYPYLSYFSKILIPLFCLKSNVSFGHLWAKSEIGPPVRDVQFCMCLPWSPQIGEIHRCGQCMPRCTTSPITWCVFRTVEPRSKKCFRFWEAVLGRTRPHETRSKETKWNMDIYIYYMYIYISAYIYIYIYNTKITVYYMMIIYAADIISTQQTLSEIQWDHPTSTSMKLKAQMISTFTNIIISSNTNILNESLSE